MVTAHAGMGKAIALQFGSCLGQVDHAIQLKVFRALMHEVPCSALLACPAPPFYTLHSARARQAVILQCFNSAPSNSSLVKTALTYRLGQVQPSAL